MKLPIYNITFDPTEFESGIDMIAITEDPAIEVFALKFKSHSKDVISSFHFDNEKQIIAGPVAIPDKPIYRKSKELGEYYAVFTKEVIERMAEKFNEEQRVIKFNSEHDENKPIEGFIKGSWLIEDTEKDKANFYGFTDLPIGTFFIEAKITDPEQWKEIKEKENVGFSLEGLLGITEAQFKSQKDNTNKTKNMKKNKFFATMLTTKKTFNKTTKKFEQTLVQSEEEILVVDEGMETGSDVEVISEDGAIVTAPDGEYALPDAGKTIVVSEGSISEVTDVEVLQEEVEEVEMEAEDSKEEEMEAEDTKEDSKEEEMEADAEIITKMVEMEARIEALEAMLAEDDSDFNKKNKFSLSRDLQTKSEKLSFVKSL